MTYEEVLVTKEMADAMMAHNTENYRRIKWDLVRKYARAMENGFWKENGEAIVFDEDGKLKNGQHRLLAIVESGVAVKMLIVRGVSRDINTWDEGGGRTATDKAKAEGLKLHTSTLGAITLVLNEFADGVYIGNDEKVQYGWDHVANLKKAEQLATKGRHYAIMKKAPCIAAVYCAIESKLMTEAEIEAFCVTVNNGIPVDGYLPDAALVLRNEMIEGIKRDDGRYYKGHSMSKPLFEITWQAMKAFKEGKKVRRKYVPNGCGKKVVQQMKAFQKEEVA